MAVSSDDDNVVMFRMKVLKLFFYPFLHITFEPDLPQGGQPSTESFQISPIPTFGLCHPLPLHPKQSLPKYLRPRRLITLNPQNCAPQTQRPQDQG